MFKKITNLLKQFEKKENIDLRVTTFIFAYVLFSIIGAYNLAHMVAFGYIIWLLETDINKN